MSLPKTILVPTDFGAGSDVALRYAIELGKALGAEIVLLHAYDLPPMGFAEGALVVPPDLVTRLGETAREGVERAVAEHGAAGARIRGIAKQGDAWRTILDAADEVGADLVVMGTHGRRGLPRALLGSVAEKVVRSARCPVLTVHADVDVPARSS